MPDPHDPEYHLGVLIGAIAALLLAIPIFWLLSE
jgi:hypothetical protein